MVFAQPDTTEMESRAASVTRVTRNRAIEECSVGSGKSIRTTNAVRVRQATRVMVRSVLRWMFVRSNLVFRESSARGRMHHRTSGADRVRLVMKEMESIAAGIPACRIPALEE